MNKFMKAFIAFSFFSTLVMETSGWADSTQSNENNGTCPDGTYGPGNTCDD